MRPARAFGWLIVAAALLSASALARLPQVLADPALVLSAGAAAVELVIAAIALAAALLCPGPARQRLGLLRPRFGLRESLVLIAGTLALSHALDALLAETGFHEQSALAGFARSLHGARGLSLGAALLAIGVLPALAEELLCRGVVQRSLVPRFGAVAAVLLASLVFGALHVEPIHAGFAMLLGGYLGVVGYWADSTWTPIACHAANNVFAVAVAAYAGPTEAGSPAEIAIGLGLAVAALVWTRNRGQQRLQPAPSSVDG